MKKMHNPDHFKRNITFKWKLMNVMFGNKIEMIVIIMEA